MSFWYRYVFKNWVRRTGQKATMWLAWHALPKYLRMWIVIRAFADATTTPPGDTETPDEVGYSLVMKAMR
jgi:hypothetical protein